MIALAGVYLAQLRVHLASQLQYRAALLLYQLSAVVEPVVSLAVWSAVASARGGEVRGYAARDFAAYFVVVMVVNHLTRTWTMNEFDSRIAEGTLSLSLLLPAHPIHNDVSDNLASKLITAPVVWALAGVLSVGFGAVFDLSARRVALFALAALLAFVLRFALEWMVALLAFWTTRSSAFNGLYLTALLFLSGQFAPLGVVPVPLREVADLLPFRWMISFPADVLLGRGGVSWALRGLGAQCLWLAVVVMLLAVVWRLGLRRYTAVGS